MTTSPSFRQLGLISLLIVLGAFNLCAYSSALPAMAAFFQRSISHIQFLIVTSLLAHSIAPIFFAALANRFNHSKAIISGLSLCILGDMLCVVSSQNGYFNLLIAGVAILSIGGNVGMTMALSLLRTYFEHKLLRHTAISMVSFAILPGIAITLASFILAVSSWEMIFLGLAIYHSLLAIAFYLSHVGKAPRNPVIFSFTAIKQKKFLVYIFMAGSLSAMIYSFTSQSPYLAMQILRQPAISFGLWSNLPSIGMLIGSLIIWRLGHHLNIKKLNQYALISMLLACLWMLASLAAGKFNILTLFGSNALLSIGIQIGFAIAASLAMSIRHDNPSSAALFSVGHYAVASLLVFITNHFVHIALWSLFCSYLFCLGIWALLNWQEYQN